MAAPSAASAQLQLAITALETQRIELSISGTLSGDASTLSSNAGSLNIQGPGRWITVDSGVLLTFSGSQPLAGRTSSFVAVEGTGSFGSRLTLGFGGSNLISGTTQGSGASFTLTASSPVFDPSAIVIADLRLHWGVSGESVQPFGIFQSNAIVPEPSAYAALLGLAALGCVVLRRRVR